MTRQLTSAIEKEYEHYLAMANKGAHSAAFVALAEIFNVAVNHDLPKGVRAKWITVTERAARTLSAQGLNCEFQDKLAQLRRIVSVPGEFDEDEILLVVTLRIELELAEAFFSHLGWASLAVCDAGVDDALRDIINDRSNRRQCKLVASLLARNWSMPVVSKWLLVGME